MIGDEYHAMISTIIMLQQTKIWKVTLKTPASLAMFRRFRGNQEAGLTFDNAIILMNDDDIMLLF